jgi:hypothetical protein
LIAIARALRLQLRHDGFRLVGRGGVADGNVRAVPGERFGRRGTEAARAARDQDDLALEHVRHENPFDTRSGHRLIPAGDITRLT